MLNIIMSLIVTLVVAGLMITAKAVLEGKDSKKLDDPKVYVAAVVVAVLVGVVNGVSAVLTGIAAVVCGILFLPIMLGLFVYLALWWRREGADWKGMVAFLILTFIFWLVAKAPAELIAAPLSGAAASLVRIIPTIAAIITAGFFIANLYHFRYKELSEDSGNEKLNGAITLAVTVLTAVFVIAVAARAAVLPSGVARKAAESARTSVAGANSTEATTAAETAGETGEETTMGSEAESTVAEAEMPQDEIEVETEEIARDGFWTGQHYYNDDLQNDGNAKNDFNFGPNPWRKNQDVNYYKSDFASRRAEDPALLSATVLALDCTLGTDYIGEILYAGYDERLNSLDRANAASRVLATDQDIFEQTNAAVNKLFTSAIEVELEKRSGINNQLYMNPASLSGIPHIVFYQADYDEGYCLVYTFKIKAGSNTKAKVIFHIPCGYQWADAAEKLDVEPEKAPETVTKSSSSSSSSSKSSKSSTSKKEKKTTSSNKGSKSDTEKITKKTTKKTTKIVKEPDGPKYDKDPEKAPKKNTELDDNKGPGEDTNSGGNKSTKDQKTNSTSKSSYEEYKKDIEETKKTNETQKKSGDSNEPSSKPKSSDAKVDNNGDKGTGHGGADAPTPKKEKAKESSSGKEINNKAGDAWDGPSD